MVKQLAFAWPHAVQKPLALSFQVPALALPDCSTGSRVTFPSGVKVILNFVPEGEAAVNGCPVKKVVFMSFGAIGSPAKAALAPKSVDIAIASTRSTQKLLAQRGPLRDYLACDLPQAFEGRTGGVDCPLMQSLYDEH
jgi:hypothetical protein